MNNIFSLTQTILFIGGKNQLPSLMESDDSELEEFLDDVMDRTNVPIKCNDISYRNYTIPSSRLVININLYIIFDLRF